MKMSKLLKLLLAPFVMYAEGGGEGGGGAATPTGDSGDTSGSSVDWGELNAGVDAGADDTEEEGSEGPTSNATPAASTAKKSDEADPTDPATGTDPADPNPEPEEGEDPDPNAQPPVDSDEKQLTPEEIAARDKQIAEDFAKWEQAETARLAEVYAFDEETASRLQTEPELVLPQVAAKLHIEVVKNALQAVQRMLPQVIPQLLQQQNVEKTAEEKFYSVNPDLKKYHKQVIQAGKMFRKLNPKATPDDAAKKIGDMVRLSLGLEPLKADPAANGKPAPAPAKPAGRAAPHKPAMPGTGGGVKAPAKAAPATDFWDQMAADDDD